MSNTPLEQRAGYNQGTQPQISPNVDFIGQPAIKAKAGDTVIFQNSPVESGEYNPRAVGLNPVFISGMVYNLTGGTITLHYILIDDQGNEFPLTQIPIQILNTQGYPLSVIGYLGYGYYGFISLPVGWSIVLRRVSGSPLAGQGVVIWPWVHDAAHNVVPIVAPITTSISEFGPPKGKGWQLQCAPVCCSGVELAEKQLAYLNFDSVTRTISAEYLHLAGEDIQISSGIVVTPRVAVVSGVEAGFNLLYGQNNFILAYPDTIKVKALQNQTTAPIYMVANFAEFDLPKDMA